MIRVTELEFIQRARRALRGRLHPALPVEGATQAPLVGISTLPFPSYIQSWSGMGS
ncbi:MAG: hypothetical protein AABZ05_05400 [Nitrospirota bacterium]